VPLEQVPREHCERCGCRGSNQRRHLPEVLQPLLSGQQSLSVSQPKPSIGMQHVLGSMPQTEPGQQSLLAVQARPGLRHALQVAFPGPVPTQLPLQQ
jgi:hypothetical protein